MWKWLNKTPRPIWFGVSTGGLAIFLVATPLLSKTEDMSGDPSKNARVALASPTSSPSPSPTSSTATPKGANKTNPTVLSASTLPRLYQPSGNGLITNEFAYFNRKSSSAVFSPDWNMTSGSLFARDGAFWTGNPDSCDPDPKSARCTNSNVFRADTTQKFSGNIRVTLSLLQLNSIQNAACNDDDSCWHGTHIWLRYQSQFNLYYASVNRADGTVVIKRKVPCGDDNSGTYYELSQYVPHNFKAGAWNNYEVTIQTNADKSVTIKLYDTDTSSTTPVATGVDRGGINQKWSSGCNVPGKYSSAHYAPITDEGGIGIRGDYANFMFKNLKVSQL